MDEASKRLADAGEDLTTTDLMDALRMLFLKSGMTVEACAIATDMAPSVVERMVNGSPRRIPPAPGHYRKLIKALGIGAEHPDFQLWKDAWSRAIAADRARRRSQQVIVTGDNASVKVVGEASASVSTPPVELPAQRQEFYFRFLGNALLQANITFLLAMLFTAAGACVTVGGAVMLLAHVGSGAAVSTPLFTTLSGLAVAGGGGAFAVHAYRARSHVTMRADQVREDIKCDVAFERATTLIDRVQDRDLKDHLLSLTAVKELGLSPAPIDLGKHLPTKHIESHRAPAPEIEAGESGG
ncbi:TRADD-N-associated membrane domain-containing protein [Nocardia beijingensis]